MPNATLIRELLAAHKEQAEILKASKDKERKLRDKIVELIFPEAKKGTNRVSYKELGLEVKAVIKENYTNKQEGLDKLMEEHESIQSAFKYKYEVVKSEYDALDDQDKQLLADIVSIKNGAPELSYEGELGKSFINNVIAATDEVATYYGFESPQSLELLLEEIR